MVRFEKVACDICGSEQSSSLLERGDLNASLEGVFRLVKCLHCGLVYQNPRPTKDSWSSLYPDNYDQYEINYVDYKGVAKIVYEYGLLKRFRLIQKYIKTGQLLDVGCATGDFLSYVSKHNGWKVVGIEPGVIANERARANGLEEIYLNLDQCLNNFPEPAFDVITLWNVIEHLYSPTEDLVTIRNLLKDNGIIVITTPNIESFGAHVFKKYWIGYELPRHFFVFSKKTLTMLLEKTGYEVIEFSNIYGEHAAFMSSLRFFIRGITNSRVKLEFLFSPLFRFFISPFFYTICALGKGSWLTVVARKKCVNH
jgi:2-polyprenyl-3-methyl-5-hydroxy-6-metoxy-1,4-benzoquinol methylase